MALDSAPQFDAARTLWAGRFQAVLATQSLAEPGYPFTSLAPYCLDAEGNALLLLSHLAQHTKNLSADPRCALSVCEATTGDVQQTLRLSCPADAEPVDVGDQGSLHRWLRYYPASLPYLDQLNFGLYRLRPRRFHFNAGFASARWLGKERIQRRGFDDAQELQALEALKTLPALASQAVPLRLVGVDPWGLDLALGERLRRIPLPGPFSSPEALRAILAAVSIA